MASSSAFRAAVRPDGGLTVIDLYGEIDGFAEAALEAAYDEAEANDAPSILLNFAGVEYVNSTGIALIVGLLARARKARRQLLTSGLTPHYQEIFNITRLSDFMTIYPTEEAARQGVSAAA
jgi:anti-anti-sigma factor